MFGQGWRGTLAAAAALLGGTALAQTWSSCNPVRGDSCPANIALGRSVNIDFTKGEVNSFIASGGTPTYGSDGVTFTVAKQGDAPQLTSVFYIMFGRVEVTMKAAPGAGIVSSLVMLSDALDEIDMEWLGADDQTVQTNYFRKGSESGYGRGQFNPAPNNQAQFITYTIDWTPERIAWYVGGTVVRTVTYEEAAGAYPQTPMQIKFGAWAGGDPNNAPGTIEWARGPTDYSKGPFSMIVRSAVITDYSTGQKYYYSDTSGNWQSIRSEGGEINGNAGNAGNIKVTATAPEPTHTIAPSIPLGGIAPGTTVTTRTPSPTGPIPDGWRITDDGKIVPIGSSTISPSSDGSSSAGSSGSSFTTSVVPIATPNDGDGSSNGNGARPTSAPLVEDAASMATISGLAAAAVSVFTSLIVGFGGTLLIPFF